MGYCFFWLGGGKLSNLARVCAPAHGVMVIIIGNGHGGPEFKSYMRLSISHNATTLGKSIHPFTLLQLWVNSMAD